MIRIVSAVCLSFSFVLAAGAAFGATLSREALERRVLDACVYRQFQVKDIDRNRMVENCRCATKTTMASLPGESFAEPRSGGLTGPQDKALRAGIAACFQ